MEEPPPALGILAGAGDFPLLMQAGARAAGRKIIGVGFKGAEQQAFIDGCDAYCAFRVGSVDGPLSFFKAHGVGEVVMTGQIKPACVYTLWPDASARKILGGLERRNAHTIYGGVCAFIESQGMRVLPSTSYMESSMAPAGLIAGVELSDASINASHRGMAAGQIIAALDIGQSLIFSEATGRVIRVEGFEGTNECIRSMRGVNDASAMLCKVSKPLHDMRFDVPCIGLATVKHCHRVGIMKLIIEAGKCIVMQRDEVEAYCNAHQMSIYACELADTPYSSPLDSHHLLNDNHHAQCVANELATHGIADCVAVCDGVIVAVGDELTCRTRAHHYLKKLRWARLMSWVLRWVMNAQPSTWKPLVIAQATTPIETSCPPSV